ncbi:hypothetical protein D3C73_890560 [compost metagenome]
MRSLTRELSDDRFVRKPNHIAVSLDEMTVPKNTNMEFPIDHLLEVIIGEKRSNSRHCSFVSFVAVMVFILTCIEVY